MQLAFLDPNFRQKVLTKITGGVLPKHPPAVRFEKHGWTVILETPHTRAGIWCISTLGENYSELLASLQRVSGAVQKVLLYRTYTGSTPLPLLAALLKNENVHLLPWSELRPPPPPPEWTVERLLEVCHC